MRDWRDGAVPDSKVWDKSHNNPVSDVDLAVDNYLQERLTAIVPTSGWLSEESVDDPSRLSRQLVWLVDPIDGTRDYVRGRRGWCVSVALSDGGLPTMAIMCAPAQEKLWIAHRGLGVTCNGDRLQASTRSHFPGSRVPTDSLSAIDHDLVIVEKPNSIAMRMTMVACDRADLVATLRWGNEWDIAAAHLIAEESGARVSNALGAPIRYNKPKPLDFGLVCSSPLIHEAAVDRLAGRAQAILETSA